MKKLFIFSLMLAIMVGTIACASNIPGTVSPSPVASPSSPGQNITSMRARTITPPLTPPTPSVLIPVPNELTDEEKNKAIEIVINSPQASAWLKGRTDYRVGPVEWYAIKFADGEPPGWAIAHEGGLPDYQFKSASWYPGVTISVGEGTIYQMQIAVDLETGKTVLVEGPRYSLSSPDRFRGRAMLLDQVLETSHAYGATVEVKLTFTNRTAEAYIISPFPPEINIIEMPNIKPPDSIVRSFSAGADELQLQPGESKEYTIAWDQKDNDGQQVPSGWYGVEVTLVSRTAADIAFGGQMRGAATRLLVLPPEGSLEKTIEVNQARSASSITVILEKVELSSQGMKISAFNSPPDYKLPQGPDLAPPQFMIMHAEAEYSLDGGTWKATGPSGIRFLEISMEHTWGDHLDPVPLGTGELRFRINTLGDYQGPWEFVIPLQ